MSVTEKIRDLKDRIATGIVPRSTIPIPLLGKVGLGGNGAATCTNLLSDTGAKATCPSCRGKVELTVFGCRVHGTCTVGKPVPGTACCKGCPDFVPGTRQSLPYEPVPVAPLPNPVKSFPEVGKRHLVYHILPVSGNGVWRRCVRELTLRWGLFTGRKIVSVATGPPVRERVDKVEKVSGPPRTLAVESVNAVRRSLPSDAEVFEVPNDPVTWERASWFGLWDRVLGTADDTDAVLYAHAKGVTRKLTSTCHFWSGLLYALALDHWDTTARLLTRYPVVGSLLKTGSYFPPPLHTSRFHYHGNVWWVRAGVARNRLAIRPLEPHGWASEAWVGSAFHRTEAGVMFDPTPQVNYLYSPQEADRVAGLYDRWCVSNPVKHLTPVV